MITKVFDFIKNITLKDIIYIIIIVLLSYCLYTSVINSNKEKDKFENNITALTDTISIYKSKNGELIATKTAFECDIKELKKTNETLYTEIKELKAKNEIMSGIHVNGEIINPTNDTVYIVKHDTLKNGFHYNFNFNNNWRDLEGNINYCNDSIRFNITKDLVKFDYTIAMDENNKIFINSDNPYVKYNNISGFTVPIQKQKRLIIGPSITTGYSIIHNRFDIIVGVSATLNLSKN